MEREDMAALFDAQLEGIYSTLDAQLAYLQKNKTSKQVVRIWCVQIETHN